MDDAYHGSGHPTDIELIERLLAREADPHLERCARCAARAENITQAIDPLREGSTEEPFDEFFYRRQASRIGARIAAGEGTRHARPLGFLYTLPRAAWVSGAVAALVVLGFALHGRAPLDRGGNQAITIASAGSFPNAQDAADDRLLREVDSTLDEDPYDFGP